MTALVLSFVIGLHYTFTQEECTAIDIRAALHRRKNVPEAIDFRKFSVQQIEAAQPNFEWKPNFSGTVLDVKKELLGDGSKRKPYSAYVSK
jgi:hypothetical protein